MDFEGQVLRQVGGFGRRARFLAAASWLPNVALALGLAAGLFLAAVPPHRCRPDPALLPAALRNATGPELLNASAPPGSRCLLYRYPLAGAAPGLPNGTRPCTRGWQYALPAAGLRSTLVTQWDLVCARHWQVPLEQTTHLLGWLVGYVALGAACDRFGRRIIFALSLVLSVPLGFGVALAVDYLMLVVMRMLFGAVLAGVFLSLYVARLELCDPSHRLIVTMSASFFWIAGQLLLPGLAVAVAEWRLLQGAITLGLTLLAACWWSPSLFPESARWLLATQQLQRGKQALLELARGNGVSLENGSPTGEPLLADLMAWLVLALSILGILASQAVAALSIFFASEVLPTVVRGAGLGLILAAHTLGQAATPLMDIQPSRGFFLHHVVFASFAVLSVLSVMLLPETSHRPLPDSVQEGESLHRPPLFHPSRRHCRRQDQLPLLSTHKGASPYDPESYAHLVTATKKMLGSRVGPAGTGGQGSPLCPET
ncbi:putative solute carrier family 22 member 31 isoform X2 [Ahaetulla prasina]|uniref:putative solute carrier family 22 member 31 isoform X2 n=1 Tax=Ahaetulla prasina TaxID=499056 RepID=UPI00264A352D|nr:putative solute carrier family 22 member 31 isoform X2 [Ahaetulla prasina]